jgi:hypothetical protein
MQKELRMTYTDTARAILKRAKDHGEPLTPALRQLAKLVRAEDVPAPPVAKATAPAATQLATSEGPAYEQLRYEGDLLFRTGQVGSSWEGMGQYAADHPELIDQIRAEERAGKSDGRSPRPTTDEADPPPLHQQESAMEPPHDDRLTKGSPAAPQTATAAWLDQIAKCQQEQPTLTYQQASDLAHLENPNLFRLHVEEQRWPQPSLPSVGKQAPLASEAIRKMVDAEVAQHPGMSRMEAWQQVLKAHEGGVDFGAVYKAYRQYQVSDQALQDHDAARLAKARAGK